MTQTIPDPASAAGAAGSGKHHKRLASDFSGNRLSAPKNQAHSQVRNPRAHLRLVEPPSPPRPRRLEVRIAADDGRAPYGRTRPFRLSDSDLERLIQTAERLEARA
jgi:hypothetical protein